MFYFCATFSACKILSALNFFTGFIADLLVENYTIDSLQAIEQTEEYLTWNGNLPNLYPHSKWVPH